RQQCGWQSLGLEQPSGSALALPAPRGLRHSRHADLRHQLANTGADCGASFPKRVRYRHGPLSPDPARLAP
ncbi:hypothetical protein LTR94_032400, partial [Friedmanniomyces endolithicus]